MALLNLSKVTQILIKFLSKYLAESTVGTWGSADDVPIVSKPPDKIGDENVLCLYLYHVAEDTQYKNLAAAGNDTPPVRFVPMGLNLYYQLSAHSSTDEDTIQAQLMMGIALKAFHDYPLINDDTEVDGVSILEEEVEALLGAGNKLRIVLQPVPYNEAVSYWNNSSSGPRLAAYYQVSVVLLEPEETASRPGRVLEYGVHTFIQGAPRLDYSQNTLIFTPPGKKPREIQLRPAQVPVEGNVSFYGSGLSGNSVSLLLKNNRWNKPVEVDPAWKVAVTGDKVEADVKEKASGKDILPGIYATLVKVIRRSTPRDGTTRDFEHISNECPFTITPRIDDISKPDNNNVVTVKGYIFKHTELKEEDVQVYVGENRLKYKTEITLKESEFEIITDKKLEFKLPADLVKGFYPLRIFVNGAESPPRWIEVT